MITFLYNLFTKAINSNNVTGVLFAVNISIFVLYVGSIVYLSKQKAVIEGLTLTIEHDKHTIETKKNDIENLKLFHSREMLLIQKELDYCQVKLNNLKP